jgi:hypothetical protein
MNKYKDTNIENQSALSVDQDELVTIQTQIMELLQFRYGDGAIYISKNISNHFNRLHTLANRYGYVNDEGYVTRKGRLLLAKSSNTLIQSYS